MKRMVGRRVVDDGSARAARVTVRGRWFWQRDEFCSEGDIDVNIIGGVLKVEMEDRSMSYSPSRWRTVSCEEVVSKSRV